MEERAQYPTEIYPPIRTDGLPKYQIFINPLDYGYMIEVGCQRFAIENVETLITKVSAYLRNPQEVITQWNESKTLPV